MDAEVLYRQVLAEIAGDEAALKKKREFAEMLRQRLNVPAVQKYSDAAQELADLASGRKTLKQQISEVVQELGAIEFDVNDVFAAMDGRWESPPMQPKSKISTVLARLVDTGDIEITARGAGSVPNRYRAVSAQQTPEDRGGESPDGLA